MSVVTFANEAFLERPASSATSRALMSCLGVGVLAAVVLPPTATGIAWSLTSIAILLVAWHARSSAATHSDIVLAVLAAALTVVPAFRSSPWLAALCLPTAAGLAALSLLPVKSWTGTFLGATSGPLLTLTAVRWLWPTLARTRPSNRRAAVVALTCVVAGVFAALFLAADPAYSAVVEHAIPLPDLYILPGRVFVLVTVVIGTAIAVYVAQWAPALDRLSPPAASRVGQWEWAVPLIGVDLVFLSFVTVQFAVLFGGRRHVLTTQGLTYAEYARHGFWQLLIVTALTLMVIAAVVRYAPRQTPDERRVIRTLLGLLCLLSLVVVASALTRMSVYQNEYGFTRLRLLVDVVELTLGAVFLLLLAAGLSLRGTWLPRATAITAAVALLAFAAINPDAYVARHDVQRFAVTGRIDTAYLGGLSADAVPELLKLPAPERGCTLLTIDRELRNNPDAWHNSNLARSRARRLLADRKPAC